jgi:hypothetical protein
VQLSTHAGERRDILAHALARAVRQVEGERGGGGGGVGGGGGDAAERNRKGAVLGEVELERMPGADLMSAPEIALCTSLKLTPHQYLIVKEVMVRESARVGHLKKKDAKSIVRLDPTKVSKIFDYLVACGWIRSGAAVGGAAKTSGLLAGRR